MIIDKSLHFTFPQNLVCNKWQTLDVTNRTNLRQYLYQLSVTQLSSNPSYVTTKLVKVYINIGIREWGENAVFFDQIMTVSFFFGSK